MKKQISKDQYISAVASKLNACQNVLAFGPVPTTGAPLRDSKGLAVTFSNVLKSAENLFDRQGAEDAIAQAVNFSGGAAGYADVSSVQTVGAIDVTIMTLSNSLVPFLAVDRAMNNPVDTIYFSDLVATNSTGGVSAGENVMSNFSPANNNVTLGAAVRTLTVTATATSEILDFATYLVPGSSMVSVTRGGTLIATGKDYDRSGKVFFTGFASAATINYTTGVATVPGLAIGDVVSVAVLQDVSKTGDGAGILRIKAVHTPVQMVTAPKNFIFEENEHANMYMARIQAQAAKVSGLGDYRELYFQRLTSLYIEDVNRDIIKVLVQLCSVVTPVSLNLSTYGVGTFAETKNDLISKFFIDMRTKFISKSGIAATVMITGTRGSAELENHPTKFVSAPSFFTQLNGFVGTFNGVPVYRHSYLDSIEGANTSTYYMAAKLPDNSSGTMVFGEFLPLTQTATVGNFANPTQKATGWFSQIGIQVIQGTLVEKGVITYV